MLGIKYPRSKFLAGSTLASLFHFSTTVGEPPSLRPDSYGSRAPSASSTARKTSPGHLREPGFVHNFCSKEDFAQTPTGAGLRPDFGSEEDFARTPTGAGLRPQFLQQGRLLPDSYGSRAPSAISTVRKTPPGLLQEPSSVREFYSKEDFVRTPTGVGLRP